MLAGRSTPAQPNRVSNSFSRAELEVVEVALRRAEQFRDLPSGLVVEDYEAISQVIQSALRGGDITGLVRSPSVQRALRKLERLRNWAHADLVEVTEESPAVRAAVMERVTKMLARARLAELQAEGKTLCG